MKKLMSAPATVWAEGSPWLPADGNLTLGVNVTSGTTEDFFVGETSQPLGSDLSGTFVWFTANYGYDDVWAFDFRTGYAEARLDSNPRELDQEDIADTSFGVSYQFINEFEADNGLPTISVRGGFTVGGDYNPNLTATLGDGASGFDLSLLVGKSITSSIALFGADGISYILSAYYTTPVPRLGFQFSAAGIRTDSSLDIGDPGFDFEFFSQTNRDSDFLIVGGNYGITQSIGVGLSYTALINGRNVPDTDVLNASFSYTF